jgi:hypothetical protein
MLQAVGYIRTSSSRYDWIPIQIDKEKETMKENMEGIEVDITIEELESKIAPDDNGETVLPL